MNTIQVQLRGKYAVGDAAFALIEEADLELVASVTWFVQVRRTNTKDYPYVYGWYRDRVVQMHRFIAGAPRGMLVDHRNGNTLDNRRSNLRICTHAENIRNCAVRCSNKLGVKGVSWDADRRRYVAKIHIDGKQRRIGRFKTIEEAALAYREAAARLHGEFANFG